MICTVRSSNPTTILRWSRHAGAGLGGRETRTDGVEGATARSLNRFGMNSETQGETREK